MHINWQTFESEHHSLLARGGILMTHADIFGVPYNAKQFTIMIVHPSLRFKIVKFLHQTFNDLQLGNNLISFILKITSLKQWKCTLDFGDYNTLFNQIKTCKRLFWYGLTIIYKTMSFYLCSFSKHNLIKFFFLEIYHQVFIHENYSP